MSHEPTLDISVILPVYDEEGNLGPLHSELTETLEPLGRSYEIIAVDDGSSDGSLAELVSLAESDPHVRVVEFRRNYGQSACFAAGFDLARGKVVFTMDADGQNDPADIPALLAEMERGEFDLVGGWRTERKEPFLTRRLPSMLANALIGSTSRIPLHDRGCSLRAYQHELVKQIKLYGELHRFIPELASMAGARMSEVPVKDRARRFGRSKYNLSKAPRVLMDLVTVILLSKYRARPMQFLGLFGLASSGLGALLGLYLVVASLVRWARQATQGVRLGPAGYGPWWALCITLFVASAQFFALGFLGELVTRAWHEPRGRSTYVIRRIIEQGQAGANGQ